MLLEVKGLEAGYGGIRAVKGVDPETGHNYDDTKRYIDALDFLSAADREKIFHGNALRVYPRFRVWEA